MRLTVDRLGHLGDGLADGIVVPLALPGEIVEGELQNDRLILPKIIVPSADRVGPVCPHYRSCGGCGLMHASDAFLAKWKVDVVRKALSGQGLEAEFRPILVSPPRSRRRATLSGRRTKKGTVVGFHGRASGTITDISGCHLLHPDLMAVLPALHELTRIGVSRSAELSIAVTQTDGGIDLSVDGGKETDPPLLSALAELCERADIARLTWNSEVLLSRRPVTQRFGKATVRLPPNAFLQATAEGEEALVRVVRDAVGPARKIADLFAGAGTFALPLAETAEVYAAEGDSAMMAALDAGWRQATGLRQVVTQVRDLFRRPLMPDELSAFDAVVIDPPRAGAEEQTTQIAASDARMVAAVSCNPVTFARDARILCEAGFRIDWVQVVDQFRWSPHVEMAARLSR